MLQFLGVVAIVFLAIYWLFVANLKTPSPTHGIYSNNGPFYYLKYCLFCILLILQKLSKSKRPPIHDGTHPLPEHHPSHGNDSIFFVGSCTRSGLTFIVATERRPNNVTYGLVYLMVCCVVYLDTPIWYYFLLWLLSMKKFWHIALKVFIIVHEICKIGGKSQIPLYSLSISLVILSFCRWK